MDAAFRRASNADVEHLLAFMREFYVEDGIAYDEVAARAALGQLLGDERFGCVWLIQSDAGQWAGYLVLTLGFSLEFHGRDAFIDELYVHPPFRGRGLGQQALAVAADWCRACGVQALHLEVGRSNTRAQALYGRAGFRSHDRHLMTRWLV